MRELTDRQRQIVDHAIEMIGEGGLSGLTMRRLSERLGVTEPALYRHFENKTAILAAMLTVLEAETYKRLPLDTTASPDALVAHFDRLFALLTERPALATVVFLDEFAATDPELQAMVRELLAKNRERLATAFAAMQTHAATRAPHPTRIRSRPSCSAVFDSSSASGGSTGVARISPSADGGWLPR